MFMSRSAMVSLFALTALFLSPISEAHAALLTAGDIVKVVRQEPDGQRTYGGAYQGEDSLGPMPGPLWGGGEFALYKKVMSNGGSTVEWEYLFRTFCLQINEVIILGEEMLVAGIGDRTVSWKNGSTPLSDAIDFLYASYRTDDWFGVDFVNDNDDWANAFQQAIWHLDNGLKRDDISQKAKELVDYSLAMTDGLYESQGVQALNLFHVSAANLKSGTFVSQFDAANPATWPSTQDPKSQFYYRQDLLFWEEPTPTIPDPGPLPDPEPGPNPVPEPGALGLWGLMLGMVLLGRSRWMRSRPSA
jgi:hypothetical protein